MKFLLNIQIKKGILKLRKKGILFVLVPTLCVVTWHTATMISVCFQITNDRYYTVTIAVDDGGGGGGGEHDNKCLLEIRYPYLNMYWVLPTMM